MRFCPVLFFLFSLAACTKNDSKPAPTTRDITGTVQVFDEFGIASNDVIGVTVTLSDSSKSMTTLTIQGGKYEFSKVPFGKYTLAVSRNGFGTNKRFGVQNPETLDSANYPLQLCATGITQMASTTVTSFSAAGKPNGSFDYWMTISPATGQGATPRFYRIFVGIDSLLAWDHWDFMVPALPITHGSGQSGNLQGLPRQIFPVGSKAWIRIYGDASPNNMYIDSSLHQWIFPCLNLNTQPASSFIIQ